MAKNCRKVSQNNVVTVKQMLKHMHEAVGYQLKDVDYTARIPVSVMGKYRLRTVDENGNCNEDCFDSPFLYSTIKLWFELKSKAIEMRDVEWEWACKSWNGWC